MNQTIVTSEFPEMNNVEMTLSSIILQLQEIENSSFLKRISALPEAHPEIETIMGDALHYTMELKLRINQSISNSAESLQCITNEVVNTPTTKQDYSVWDTVTPGQVKQDYYVGIVEGLNATQARRVASLLKKKSVIDQTKKLSGKGIGRDWLIFLIQDHLPTHQEEVKQALQEVLKRELL
ncbi:hypothetical protein SD80_012505 [Scytonema tolypothrichoides VB-61278]|nr:hypothetical protein SD80_012505 [Scytonema tolypothrichoides VB-61278]